MYFKTNCRQIKYSLDKLIYKSIALIDQRSVLVKIRRTDRSQGSVERSRSALSSRSVALLRNLIASSRAGFTMVMAWRYCQTRAHGTFHMAYFS
jgi:hypothetical protein